MSGPDSYPKMDYVHCYIDQGLLFQGICCQHNLTDGMQEICWKVLRNKLTLVDCLEKTIVTCRLVLCTSKDEDLEDVETNMAEHTLHTLVVRRNEHEVVELEEEPQPTQELHTSLNRLQFKMDCQSESQTDLARMQTCPLFIENGVSTGSPNVSVSDPGSRRLSSLSGTGGNSYKSHLS